MAFVVTLPIRQTHGLLWYVDQADAGYFRQIVHALDHSSRRPRVAGRGVSACGAAAIPLPEDAPPPTGWQYCVSPLCWQQRTVESKKD